MGHKVVESHWGYWVLSYSPWSPPLALLPQSVAAPPLVSVALDLLGPSLGLPGLSLGLRWAFLAPFLRP